MQRNQFANVQSDVSCLFVASRHLPSNHDDRGHRRTTITWLARACREMSAMRHCNTQENHRILRLEQRQGQTAKIRSSVVSPSRADASTNAGVYLHLHPTFNSPEEGVPLGIL